MKKRIAITGPNGFLGKHLIKYLKDISEYELILLSRKTIDLTDTKKMVEKLSEVDVLIHTAGLIVSRSEQEQRPADILLTNLELDISITNAVLQSNVKRIIFCSSVTAYGTPDNELLTEDIIFLNPIYSTPSEYALSKRVSCALSKAMQSQYKKEFTSIILPNLYGPGDKFHYTPPPLVPNVIASMYTAKTNEVPSINGGSNGKHEIELMYIQDTVKALHGLIEYNKSLPPIINIGVGSTSSIEDIYQKVADILGYKGAITWQDVAVVAKPKKLNNELLGSLIDWKPETSLHDGLRQTIESYLTNLKQEKP